MAGRPGTGPSGGRAMAGKQRRSRCVPTGRLHAGSRRASPDEGRSPRVRQSSRPGAKPHNHLTLSARGPHRGRATRRRTSTAFALAVRPGLRGMGRTGFRGCAAPTPSTTLAARRARSRQNRSGGVGGRPHTVTLAGGYCGHRERAVRRTTLRLAAAGGGSATSDHLASPDWTNGLPVTWNNWSSLRRRRSRRLAAIHYYTWTYAQTTS